MNKSQSYFGSVILLIFLSIIFFVGAKRYLPKRLFPDVVVENNNILVDSLLLEAMSQPTDSIRILPDEDSLNVVETQVDPISYTDNIAVTGNNTGLSRFFAKLHKLEKEGKGNVRIGYFGDSMTDGDLIVQDVRASYQSKYGGNGVGFVAITSLSAQSRYSVSHQFSTNWFTQSFISTRSPNRPFGIDGQVEFSKAQGEASSWVQYKAQGMQNAYWLYRPLLMYGSSDVAQESHIKVKVDKDSVQLIPLTPTKILNTIRLSSKNAKSLRVDFYNSASIPFYGFNFDDGQGVHIDNFSLRGNSGLPLSMLSTGLMQSFDQLFGYDLIILQYGANVLASGAENFDWYSRSMEKVVLHLKQCFPNADILILSTADKASKIDGEMKTDPAVGHLIKAQKDYANKTGAGFISLYELMGGEGSMVKWVDEKLANKDYTHVGPKGAKKMAGLIFNEIENRYTVYKKTRSDNGVEENVTDEVINITPSKTDSVR